MWCRPSSTVNFKRAMSQHGLAIISTVFQGKSSCFIGPQGFIELKRPSISIYIVAVKLPGYLPYLSMGEQVVHSCAHFMACAMADPGLAVAPPAKLGPSVARDADSPFFAGAQASSAGIEALVYTSNERFSKNQGEQNPDF